VNPKVWGRWLPYKRTTNSRAELSQLSEIFRRKGYAGASYSDLMKATGFVKASLYHRFPGGKAEMVDAILSDVDREFSEYVVKPAFEAGVPVDRARKIARRLREFYKSGQQWCLLDTVTLADSPSTREHARRSMEFWIDAFARLGRDAGLSPAIARRRSQEAVAAIEGGLESPVSWVIAGHFCVPSQVFRSG
jgi:TetR/AcrR family transcriptional repressor of lmrAB and yxaGH operons